MMRRGNRYLPNRPAWPSPLAWCPPKDSPLLGGAGPASDERGLAFPTPESVDQEAVTRRYDRMAWLHDVYDAPMELMGTRRRRRRLLPHARGSVLEVGVGTGRNLEHYGEVSRVCGIDVSIRMLARARRRAAQASVRVDLLEADAHALPFADDEFDTSVATCVFCSVADPVRALRELGRVTRPDGRILLLEHVRPRHRLLGRLADIATAVTRRLFGFRANRRTEENVIAAGLEITDVRREGVWREIIAVPQRRASTDGGEDAGS